MDAGAGMDPFSTVELVKLIGAPGASILLYHWITMRNRRDAANGSNGAAVPESLVNAIVAGVNNSWQNERSIQRETGLGVQRLEAHELAETQVFNGLIAQVQSLAGQVQRLADTIDRMDRRLDERKRR